MFLIISHMNVQQCSLWSKSLILVIQFITHLSTRMILPACLPSLHLLPFFRVNVEFITQQD